MHPKDAGNIVAQFAGSLKVLYEGSIVGSVQDTLRSCAGRYSILQMAFSLPEQVELELIDSWVPTTSMVSADDPRDSIAAAVSNAKWMVVCKLARETGGELFDQQRIESALRLIRSLTVLPVFCAFGISSAATVAFLRDLGTCDGAIVGTSLLVRLDEGIEPTRSFITSLQDAATK